MAARRTETRTFLSSHKKVVGATLITVAPPSNPARMTRGVCASAGGAPVVLFAFRRMSRFRVALEPTGNYSVPRNGAALTVPLPAGEALLLKYLRNFPRAGCRGGNGEGEPLPRKIHKKLSHSEGKPAGGCRGGQNEILLGG